VSTGSQGWRSALVGAIVVMATMGCGDGQQTDPRNLTYCGGTCWGTLCCAPSNDACPSLMPLDRSPCAPTGTWCGYACGEPYGARYHMAECRADGWHVGVVVCDWFGSPDGGAAEDGGDGVPDAAGDAGADAAPPDGS
jgi:hypothetical protein